LSRPSSLEARPRLWPESSMTFLTIIGAVVAASPVGWMLYLMLTYDNRKPRGGRN